MSTQPNPEGGFVRLALPAEASRVAELQRDAWQDRGVAGSLPDPDEATSLWTTAILRPPLASYRVLVALDASKTVLTGFAALGPSDDPDAEPRDAMVGEFAVAAGHRREGHGSRLLQALVDTLRADGFERVTWWLASTDDTLRAFLLGAGWAPDGAHREIGTEDGSLRLKQTRMHTGIA